MAAKSFIRLVGGVFREVFGVQSSAGAANAGDVVALDDTGRIDTSMMPVGIGADTQEIATSESIAAGDFVNVWNDGGTPKVRKADASSAGKDAHGFVLEAASAGNPATVYFEGTNTQVTGQVAGIVYLQTVAGSGGNVVPSASGNVVQQIGIATSATTINFERGTPVVLA
jgi:hypothetical protein